MLALSTLDPTLAGIIFLVAVVLFVLAAWILRATIPTCLVALGLAACAFVWMWDRFAAA